MMALFRRRGKGVMSGMATRPVGTSDIHHRTWWPGVALGVSVSCACAYQQFKLPPILPDLLREHPHAPAVAAGFMSVYALIGLMVSQPLGRWLQGEGRLGSRPRARRLGDGGRRRACAAVAGFLDPVPGRARAGGPRLRGLRHRRPGDRRAGRCTTRFAVRDRTARWLDSDGPDRRRPGRRAVSRLAGAVVARHRARARHDRARLSQPRRAGAPQHRGRAADAASDQIAVARRLHLPRCGRGSISPS